jgi:hypothetical protein
MLMFTVFISIHTQTHINNSYFIFTSHFVFVFKIHKILLKKKNIYKKKKKLINK